MLEQKKKKLENIQELNLLTKKAVITLAEGQALDLFKK